MRTDEVRLALGVRLEKRALDRGSSREDLVCVLEEDPEFVNGLGDQLSERAKAIRGDKDCFRLLNDEVVIEMPAMKRPTLEELKKYWNLIHTIERDDSIEEAVTFRLATVLQSTEERINGMTYERRLALLCAQGRLLGFQHMQWLVKKQEEFPALMALLRRVNIAFPGIVVVLGDSYRLVPCVGPCGDRFDNHWSWLDGGIVRHNRIAVSSSPRSEAGK